MGKNKHQKQEANRAQGKRAGFSSATIEERLRKTPLVNPNLTLLHGLETFIKSIKPSTEKEKKELREIIEPTTKESAPFSTAMRILQDLGGRLIRNRFFFISALASVASARMYGFSPREDGETDFCINTAGDESAGRDPLRHTFLAKLAANCTLPLTRCTPHQPQHIIDTLYRCEPDPHGYESHVWILGNRHSNAEILSAGLECIAAFFEASGYSDQDCHYRDTADIRFMKSCMAFVVFLVVFTAIGLSKGEYDIRKKKDRNKRRYKALLDKIIELRGSLTEIPGSDKLIAECNTLAQTDVPKCPISKLIMDDPVKYETTNKTTHIVDRTSILKLKFPITHCPITTEKLETPLSKKDFKFMLFSTETRDETNSALQTLKNKLKYLGIRVATFLEQVERAQYQQSPADDSAIPLLPINTSGPATEASLADSDSVRPPTKHQP